MTYVTPTEKYLLLSNKKVMTVPILDVLYNHSYKFPFKKLGPFHSKNKVLNELKTSITNVTNTLIKGVIIMEYVILDLNKI